MTPDNELLRRYTEQGDEAAFAEIVQRHLNLVYACVARVLNNDLTLTQDVAQTVFTDLARKATTLQGHPTLAGWLHTSARFAASKVARTEHNRRTREQEAGAMNNTITSADTCWTQLRPALDVGIGQLREADRDALLLRFFEDKSHREIGEVLGVSERAAQMRVERALEKLRGKFSRRGVTTTAGLLASALGAHGAVVTVPAGLSEVVSAKSLSEIASANSVVITPSWRSKTSLSLTAVVLILAGILVGFLFMPAKPAPKPPATQQPVAAKVEAPKALPAPPIASAAEAPSPTLYDLGEIKFTATGTLQSFPLKSGLVFTIRRNAFNVNGTISLSYGVHDPSKANTRGGFHIAGRRPDEHNALSLEVDYSQPIRSGTAVQESLFNGEMVKFTPVAPKLDGNDLGEIYFTPGQPLKYVLHSGKILTLLFESAESDRILITEKVYNSEQDYLAGNSSGGGHGNAQLNHLIQYTIGSLEIVAFTPKN